MILTPRSLGFWNTISRKVFRAQYTRQDDDVLRSNIVDTFKERRQQYMYIYPTVLVHAGSARTSATLYLGIR